jgi:hypothetical protein
MKRRMLLGAVVLAFAVAAAGCLPAPVRHDPPPATAAPPPTTAAPPLAPPRHPPAGLPQHFAVGLAAAPPDVAANGWVAQAAVPFDYTYTYLAGGVNTGTGWATWNSNAMYPLYYAQSAHARGAVPVFPYYMLLQSNGPCSACSESAKDLAHLDDPTVMAAYYADFAKLMQRLGPGTYDGVAGYGGTAIVHVDPDLSGYAQQAVLSASGCAGHCSGTGNDPTLLHASVASSGFAPIAGYANNYAGFNFALLHLRDLYAPNVKLAFHVSNWSTWRDIGSDTDPNLDPVAQGNLAGAFAAASGVTNVPPGTSTYDLVFNDVADRDAGYSKYVLGRAHAFWDRTNATLPNFARWEQYVHAVVSRTGRSAMIWQVPLGNQWSASENNTDGHYQDNRAEYFFSHVNELANAGIIGVLYGRGNGGSTINTDDKGDGVTNPAAVCTSDGTSSGTVCANHPATVPDDDGGYLRTTAASYYAGPVPL